MNPASLPMLLHRHEALRLVEDEEKAKREAVKEKNEAVNQLRQVRQLAGDALDAMAHGASDNEIRRFLRDISAGARRR